MVFLGVVGITLVGVAALLLLAVVDRVTGGLVDAFPSSWQFGAWFALTVGGCYAAHAAYQRIRNGTAAAAAGSATGLWVATGGDGSDDTSGDDGVDAATPASGGWDSGDDRDRGYSSADTGSGSGSGSSDSGGGSSSSSND